MRIMRFNFIFLLALMGVPTYAQEMTNAEEGDSGDAIDAASGSLDDSTGSIEAGRKTHGWKFKGDLRVEYSGTEADNRDGTDQSSSVGNGRFRIGSNYGISESVVIGGRLASPCSTDDCDPNLTFDSTLPTTTSINNGDITFDELYIHGFRQDKFDVAIGRLQTKFVSRAGVFAHSLDRDNGSGTNVNWTDGVHAVLHVNKAWAGHLVLEHNDSDGTGSIRRGPIDFSHDDAKITYFMGWENFQRFGPINQQGFDVTYMPRSLLKDGSQNGRIEDYVGLVGRFAASWPEGSTGPRINVAGEFGYAPETPTRAAVGLAGSGDADGLAYILSVSAVDIRPNHSIGINYSRAGAGWLISPHSRDNEESFEIRYAWRRSSNVAIDVRVRWRQELEQLENASRSQKDFNAYVRLSLGFGH